MLQMSSVINNTGLTGKYDVKLQPVPDSLPLQTDPADRWTKRASWISPSSKLLRSSWGWK